MHDRRYAKSAVLFILLVVLVCGNLAGQQIHNLELTKLIDIPTAGILQTRQAQFTSSVFKDGGISFGAGVGILPKFMFGIEYGGEKLLGSEAPNWDNYPGVYVKYRLLDETPQLPAIAMGFDSRGYGAFQEETDSVTVNRFELKSKGFYVVASQNFDFMGELGIHFGANYSIEEDDNDDDVNCFLGIDKSINRQIGIFAEYDFAFNDNGKSGDNETYSFGEENGYLNLAIYLNLTDSFKFRINFRDLLENQYDRPDRSLTIKFSQTI